jgi:hypothetical protein
MAGGAYPDDMARFLRLSDEDVERMFRGVPPEADEDLRDLAFFLTDAAESLSAPPSSEVETGHLARLAEVIGSGSAPERRSTATVPVAHPVQRRKPTHRHGMRWVFTVVTAALSVTLLTGALAWAGVDLPGTAAETAFAKVFGVELPNQADQQDGAIPEELPDDAADTANAVLDVIAERRAGAEWSGCEFGQRVSAAARGETQPDTSHCAAGSPEAGTADGVGGGGSAGGSGSENAAHAEHGLETADEASDGAASAGAGHADDGLETADEASDGAGSSAGGGNAEEGSDIAEQASNGKAGGPGDGGGS